MEESCPLGFIILQHSEEPTCWSRPCIRLTQQPIYSLTAAYLGKKIGRFQSCRALICYVISSLREQHPSHLNQESFYSLMDKSSQPLGKPLGLFPVDIYCQNYECLLPTEKTSLNPVKCNVCLGISKCRGSEAGSVFSQPCRHNPRGSGQ